MSENTEVMKCHNPNTAIPMCRECQRSGKSETNEYETYPLENTKNGYACDGYVSKRQTETLF